MCCQGLALSETYGEEYFLRFFWYFASNPWHSLACSCSTLVSASVVKWSFTVHMSVAVFLLFLKVSTYELLMDDLKHSHSWFSSGIQMFKITPTIAASAIPDIERDKSPDTTDNVAPPKPRTSMVAATTTFFVLLKST